MIFAQKLLVPGPGTKPRAAFRWRPFQSALSGSRFFKPPALPEVVTFYEFFNFDSGNLTFSGILNGLQGGLLTDL
jgi:hypothetical protein